MKKITEHCDNMCEHCNTKELSQKNLELIKVKGTPRDKCKCKICGHEQEAIIIRTRHEMLSEMFDEEDSEKVDDKFHMARGLYKRFKK